MSNWNGKMKRLENTLKGEDANNGITTVSGYKEKNAILIKALTERHDDMSGEDLADYLGIINEQTPVSMANGVAHVVTDRYTDRIAKDVGMLMEVMGGVAGGILEVLTSLLDTVGEDRFNDIVSKDAMNLFGYALYGSDHFDVGKLNKLKELTIQQAGEGDKSGMRVILEEALLKDGFMDSKPMIPDIISSINNNTETIHNFAQQLGAYISANIEDYKTFVDKQDYMTSCAVGMEESDNVGVIAFCLNDNKKTKKEKN